MKDKEITFEKVSDKDLVKEFLDRSSQIENIVYQNVIVFKNLNDFLRKYTPMLTETFYIKTSINIIFCIVNYDSNILFQFIYNPDKEQ